MNSTHIKRFLLVSPLFLSAIPALAPAATLQDLFNGASLDVGSVRFDNWQLLSLDTLVPPGPDFAQIDVLPLVDVPTNPGFQLVANGQLSTTELNTIDLSFGFDVTSISGDRFAGHNLELADFNIGGASGIIFITGEHADGAGNPLTSSLVMADKEADFFLLSDGSGFASQEEIDVTLNIFVAGFSDPVILASFEQRFSLVPEPSALPLLLGTILLRRNTSSRRATPLRS